MATVVSVMGLRLKGRWTLASAFLLLALLGLAYWSDRPGSVEKEEAHQSHPEDQRVAYRRSLEEPIPAYPFTLLDQYGRLWSLKDWRGRILLISFMYSRCPTICPLLAKTFLQIQSELGGYIPDNLALVFITVDPEYDGPKVLKAWTEAFGGRWFALSGSREECEEVWRRYGVAVLREPGSSEVGHTVKTLLIDREGLIRIEYYGIPRAQEVLQDLRALLRGT